MIHGLSSTEPISWQVRMIHSIMAKHAGLSFRLDGVVRKILEKLAAGAGPTEKNSYHPWAFNESAKQKYVEIFRGINDNNGVITVSMDEVRKNPELYAPIFRDISAMSVDLPLFSDAVWASAPYYDQTIAPIREAVKALQSGNAKVRFVDRDSTVEVPSIDAFGHVMTSLLGDAESFERARSSLASMDKSIVDYMVRSRAARIGSLDEKADSAASDNRLTKEKLLAEYADNAKKVNERLLSRMSDQAARSLLALTSGIEKLKENPNAYGFMDWLKDNPLLGVGLPAAALLVAFGGNTGEIVGLIGLIGGGALAYQRYRRMMHDTKAQSAIVEFINRGGNKEALKAIESIYGREYAQACQDFALVMGAKFLESHVAPQIRQNYQFALSSVLKLPLYPTAPEFVSP